MPGSSRFYCVPVNIVLCTAMSLSCCICGATRTLSARLLNCSSDITVSSLPQVQTTPLPQPKTITLSGIGGNCDFLIQEPLQLEYRDVKKGPLTFEVLVAMLKNMGIIIPSGAVIITSRNKIADKEDVVESDDNSRNAHLTIVQSSSVQRYYFEERPSALHSLPDAPLATVYSLRVQHVHRTSHEQHSTNNEIILCSSCRALVDAD